MGDTDQDLPRRAGRAPFPLRDKGAGVDARPVGGGTVRPSARGGDRGLTTHVGKESNKIEQVEPGLEHVRDEVRPKYADAERAPLDGVPAAGAPAIQSLAERAAARGPTEREPGGIRVGWTIPRRSDDSTSSAPGSTDAGGW